jgi:hypothetical protein
MACAKRVALMFIATPFCVLTRGVTHRLPTRVADGGDGMEGRHRNTSPRGAASRITA